MLEAGSLAAAQARSLLDFIVPEHRAAFVALHQRVIGGASGTLEFEVIGLKGGRRWLETHATPLAGAGGEAPMLLGVTRDITDRKRAEEELRNFRMAMDVSPDTVYLTDPETMRFVYLNDTGLPAARLHARAAAADGPAGRAAARPRADQPRIRRGRRGRRQGLIHERAFVRKRRQHALDRAAPARAAHRLRKPDRHDRPRRHRAQGRGSQDRPPEPRVRDAERNQQRDRAHRDADELCSEACRIAVAEGGFILARVLELDAQGWARIAATTESDSSAYQRLIDEHNRDPEHSQALIALALRSGQPLISNDVARRRAHTRPRGAHEAR
jgi:PAS domain-containing protein